MQEVAVEDAPILFLASDIRIDDPQGKFFIDGDEIGGAAGEVDIDGNHLASLTVLNNAKQNAQGVLSDILELDNPFDE
jgi:hypothetical protein